MGQEGNDKNFEVEDKWAQLVHGQDIVERCSLFTQIFELTCMTIFA